MYGGLAQIMMMYRGLNSIIHGVHYQMHKAGLSQGGGPAHYFYVPNLRHRIRTIEASAIITRQKFSESEYCGKVCNCDVCTDIISRSPGESIFMLEGNDKEKVQRLTEHFTFNKSKEVLMSNSHSKEKFVNWIIEGVKGLSLTTDEVEYIQTLSLWSNSILGLDIPVNVEEYEVEF